jgi:single-strand DNA-binding protein
MLIGHVGSDPELKATNNGTAVCNLSIATNERWEKDGQKQEKTEWHRVTVWGKTAENVGKFVKKGSTVLVEGKLQTRQWEDKSGQKRYQTEIVAHSVLFLDGRKNGNDTQRSNGDSAFDKNPESGGTDGDLPF